MNQVNKTLLNMLIDFALDMPRMSSNTDLLAAQMTRVKPIDHDLCNKNSMLLDYINIYNNKRDFLIRFADNFPDRAI